MGKHGLSFDLKYTGLYPKQRINNNYIMIYKVLSDKFTLVKIKKLNYCRIYLRVTTVSDITLADGRTLDPYFRSRNESLYSSKSEQLQAEQH